MLPPGNHSALTTVNRMEALQEQVIRILRTVEEEETLVQQLSALAEERGATACRAIFQVLTTLDLPEAEATSCWRESVAHRQRMSEAMGREVDLRTAICDYFTAIHRSLKNPKVVELHIFERTVRHSSYDFLTGLFNRRYLDEALERELALAARHDKDVGLVFFDIDDFKQVNDQYGHTVGDMALKHLASVILAEKRAGDIAARYGGEEFVLVLPYTDAADALIVAERIRQSAERCPLRTDGLEIPLTVSGGLVAYPRDGQDAATLLQHADKAMYRAKGAGKNTIALFHEDRRRYLRLAHRQPLTIRPFGSQEPPVAGMSRNVGLGGVYLSAPRPFPPGQLLEIVVDDPLLPLCCIGRVVRCVREEEGVYAVGVTVAFQELDRRYKNQVARLLARAEEETAAGDRAGPGCRHP